jgi:hypothetical protein
MNVFNAIQDLAMQSCRGTAVHATAQGTALSSTTTTAWKPSESTSQCWMMARLIGLR